MSYVTESKRPPEASSIHLRTCHKNEQGKNILPVAFRPNSRWWARFCITTVLIITSLALIQSLQGQLYQLISQSSKYLSSSTSSSQDDFPLSELEAILNAEIDATLAPVWSQYYTSQSHFPGEGKSQGLWTKQKWEEFGIPETQFVRYNASISAPIFQRLALLNNSEASSLSTMYEARLMEELPFDDPSEVRTPAFHGQSYSGNVTAQFVFANFGRDEDYDDLEQNNVEVKGKIAIVKSGMVWRGAKMSAAVKRGLVGLLVYSDPQQDGEITEQNGYKAYPEGPARPGTCIERGAIGSIHNASAGNPSIPGQSIPSLPVSYDDIIPFLKALHGYGPKAAEINSKWLEGGLYYKGVEYYIGPSPAHIVLNLENQMAFPNKDVHQAFGIINGTNQDEVIILGNHRDSWGPGAGDSISGAAALMEVARSFASAYKKGWRPRRTIIFVSWEGAETGQIGSQPWIAEHLPWLKKTGVAYLNVVVGAAGPDFQVKATPLLQKVIHDVTKEVTSPEGGTVFDHWGGRLVAAGGGDAIPFLETACVSTADFSFGATYWAYHSNFDTFTWMNTTGDPEWKYHIATAKIWSLVTARLTEMPVLDFKAVDYAVALQNYVQRLKESLPSSVSFDLEPLTNDIAMFRDASTILDAYASSIKRAESSPTIQQVNQKYLHLERQFCYKGAHLVYDFSAFYSDPMEFPKLFSSLVSKNYAEARVSHCVLDFI